MDLAQYLVTAVPIGLTGAILVASILALQGQRSWGTWLMFVGIALSFLSAVGFLGALFAFNRAINNARSAGPPFQEYYDLYDLSSTVYLSLVSSTAIFLFLGSIGFLAVAKEWVQSLKHCEALEAQTKKLAEQRGSPELLK